jgi:hypothetical protein
MFFILFSIVQASEWDCAERFQFWQAIAACLIACVTRKATSSSLQRRTVPLHAWHVLLPVWCELHFDFAGSRINAATKHCPPAEIVPET